MPCALTATPRRYMQIELLKSLFSKKEFDWDSKEYLKKTLELVMETKIYNLYQEDKNAKSHLEQELIDLINDVR